MNRSEIIIPAGTKYLSDEIRHLPANCLFDKGRVGCGGTTIALRDDKPTIILVPFVSLVESKVAQLPNLLGVIAGVTDNDIKKYLEQTEIPKIIATYDSLPKILNVINPLDFSLLIDEYHLLFTQYSLRGESAIKEILNSYLKFNEYCFMTATVLDEDFILEELKELPIVIARWEDIREVTVNSIQCNSNVKHTVSILINNFLLNNIEGNAYIFVNSVDFIKELISHCKLTDSNTRAIWSRNNKKEIGLIKSSSIDPVKKINFITSTCFEGCDFYDEDAKIFIISDGSKSNTLVDISTSFQQIAGRIRNTKYWNQINHIFSTTRYNTNLDYNDYKDYINKSIIADKEDVEAYNNLPERSRQKISIEENTSYISKVDNKFIFDANLVKLDLYNYRICKSLYTLRVNISKELIDKGFKVVEHISNIKNEVIVLDKELTFADIVKALKEMEHSEGHDIIEVFQRETLLHKIAFEKYPILKIILKDNNSTLGFKFIEDNKFNLTNIKNKLVALSDKSEFNKIYQLLVDSNKVNIGNYISSDDAKRLFTKIYKELGIKKSAKGTDLNTYFETRIRTDKNRGFIILRAKSLFK